MELFWYSINFIISQLMDALYLAGAKANVSHISILSETNGTSIGVHTSYGKENSVKTLIANDENAFKILTLGSVRK